MLLLEFLPDLVLEKDIRRRRPFGGIGIFRFRVSFALSSPFALLWRKRDLAFTLD